MYLRACAPTSLELMLDASDSSLLLTPEYSPVIVVATKYKLDGGSGRARYPGGSRNLEISRSVLR